MTCSAKSQSTVKPAKSLKMKLKSRSPSSPPEAHSNVHLSEVYTWAKKMTFGFDEGWADSSFRCFNSMCREQRAKKFKFTCNGDE